MSDWTSLNAIMRDLSVAQGRDVPASLEIIGNCAPPTVIVEEATEEVYYKSFGDVDFSKPPDYGLIQEMLSRVKHEQKPLDGDILLRSDLSPLSLEFVPGERYGTEIVKKVRREKNVAMQSILQGLEINRVQKNNEMLGNPKAMFVKKHKEEKKSVTVSSPQSYPVIKQINNNQYIPTPLADAYYKKYRANAELKNQIKANIWERLEPQIIEIDERQVLKSSCKNTQGSSEEGSANSWFLYGDSVNLEQPRHSYLDTNEDCIVCNLAAKHGYYFANEEF